MIHSHTTTQNLHQLQQQRLINSIAQQNARQQPAINEVRNQTAERVNSLLTQGQAQNNQGQTALGVKSDATQIQNIGRVGVSSLLNGPVKAAPNNPTPAASPQNTSSNTTLSQDLLQKAWELFGRG